MNLTILRTYYPEATNGELFIDGKFHSFTIEREWDGNKSRKSCIPEGTYQVVKRGSAKYGEHLHITGVPGRDLILIHPANYEETELLGCIAPVVSLYATPGTGGPSKPAAKLLYKSVFKALAVGKVFITIKKK